MTLTVTKERFLTLMSYFPEARDYYKPKAEARRIEYKRLMRNFYAKLENHCLLDQLRERGKMFPKAVPMNNDSSDENEISVEELLLRADNPDLKTFERS